MLKLKNRKLSVKQVIIAIIVFFVIVLFLYRISNFVQERIQPVHMDISISITQSYQENNLAVKISNNSFVSVSINELNYSVIAYVGFGETLISNRHLENLKIFIPPQGYYILHFDRSMLGYPSASRRHNLILNIYRNRFEVNFELSSIR